MIYRTFLHCENGERILAVFAEESVDEIVSRELEHNFTFINESKSEFDSKVRCIEFLNASPVQWRNSKVTIKRIFSLSDAFMARHQLSFKYRAEFVIHYPNGSRIKSGCAYVPGMFGEKQATKPNPMEESAMPAPNTTTGQPDAKEIHPSGAV